MMLFFLRFIHLEKPKNRSSILPIHLFQTPGHKRALLMACVVDAAADPLTALQFEAVVQRVTTKRRTRGGGFQRMCWRHCPDSRLRQSVSPSDQTGLI